MSCSGDAVYTACQALVYEISRDYPGIEMKVVSGVTAALSAVPYLERR